MWQHCIWSLGWRGRWQRSIWRMRAWRGQERIRVAAEGGLLFKIAFHTFCAYFVKGHVCICWKLIQWETAFDWQLPSFATLEFQINLLLLLLYNCNWVESRWQQYSTHLHTNSTQNRENGTHITIKRKHLRSKLWSAGRAPSLRVIPWHLPYNWGKSTEKPQLG
jgi:hypothetical protein